MDDFHSEDFDILNLRTYNSYDWAIFAAALIFFGMICFCLGCYAHKWDTEEERLVEDDVKEFTRQGTVLSPSEHTTKKYTFAGFNIFGEALPEMETRIAAQVPSHTSCNSVIQSFHSQQSSMISEKEYNHQSTRTMSNIDALQRDSVPSITIPNKSDKIVPHYNVDRVRQRPFSLNRVQTPDSDVASQSHLTIEM
eukprot:201998_1